MTYTAVFFDLFDTLVRFERDRLPLIEIGGKSVRSTAGHLHAALATHVPEVTLEHCYGALAASWQEAERLRAIDHREVSAQARFADFFQRLALDPARLVPGLDVMLIDAHRDQLAKAAFFPPHHRPLLERLARRHRLAVVSNFDYSPTALTILETGGVRELFAAIVVSDEVGWRKPRPDIFRERSGGPCGSGGRSSSAIAPTSMSWARRRWAWTWRGSIPAPGAPGRHRAAHLQIRGPGRARRHHELGVDQKRSSRCSSPWYSQNAVACRSSAATRGPRGTTPARRDVALTVTSATTRSSSPSTLCTSMLNAPPDRSIVCWKKRPT
jgi:putative hydrolase of the HAD superfamily